MTTTAKPTTAQEAKVGSLLVFPFAHPQGCRSYLVCDPDSRQSMAIDPHLDLIPEISALVEAGGWTLPYVVDTHTHADHPSGSKNLAENFRSTRIAHEASEHVGVRRHPKDGSELHLGDVAITVRHAPGHTPDHLVLSTDDVLFSGDTLLIGGVARTDFLGGDAGQLFDSLQRLLETLNDDVVVYPGHDYAGRIESTIGKERTENPWLQIADRDEFVRSLTANPPPRPANMDALLRLNRDGSDIPPVISAAATVEQARSGGVGSIIDIRTAYELQEEYVAGALHVTLEDIGTRTDDIRAVPAPRLLMCRSGRRAELARKQLEAAGISGLSVVEGGILAFAAAGGETVKGKETVSLERQVRIAAGCLIVLGTVLGFLVHPALHLLSAFIGAGLAYAGVTDRCGMALMLTKLPWNRVDESGPGGEHVTGGSCAAPTPPTAGGGCAAPPPGT